jgi:hypothetical protein
MRCICGKESGETACKTCKDSAARVLAPERATEYIAWIERLMPTFKWPEERTS